MGRGIVPDTRLWQQETGITDSQRVSQIVLKRQKTMSPRMEVMLTDLSLDPDPVGGGGNPLLAPFQAGLY